MSLPYLYCIDGLFGQKYIGHKYNYSSNSLGSMVLSENSCVSSFDKGFPKVKTNFWLQKQLNILRCLVLTKKNIWSFGLFTLKNRPSRSRRSASGVKEKCIGGQGEVRQGSRKSASGVKVKCIGGQGEVLPQNVWYLAEALLLNP